MGVTTKGVFKRAEWLKERVGYQGDDCLLWPFAKNYNGYGNLKYAEGKWTYAHRLMCIYAHGEPPAPKSVAAHSCGNGGKGCVNPRHLSWKSNSDNQMDRHAQGTFRAQQDGRTGRLTWEQVQEIRALKGQMNQREIARKFGVSFQNVSMIQQGKTWQRPEQLTYRNSIRAALRTGPMSPEQVRLAAKLSSISKAYNHLAMLQKSGEVRRIAPGQYALAEK